MLCCRPRVSKITHKSKSFLIKARDRNVRRPFLFLKSKFQLKPCGTWFKISIYDKSALKICRCNASWYLSPISCTSTRQARARHQITRAEAKALGAPLLLYHNLSLSWLLLTLCWPPGRTTEVAGLGYAWGVQCRFTSTTSTCHYFHFFWFKSWLLVKDFRFFVYINYKHSINCKS